MLIHIPRMVRIAGLLTAGLTGLSDVTFGGAREDCQKLSGDSAIAACDLAIKTNPRDAISLGNRGFEFWSKRQLDRGLTDLNRALEIDPKNANNHAIRALIHRDKGNVDLAIAGYSEAIRLDPRSKYYYDRGFVLYTKKNYDRAIADFNEAIRLDPKHDLALYYRAGAHRAKGDAARAAADYAQAIGLNADLATVMIFFDYESSTLSQSAQPLIEEIAELMKGARAKTVRIVAHTDLAEPNSEKLSLSRATVIRDALVAKGLTTTSIIVQGMGSASPLVPTPVGAKEPQNRRAQVTVIP